MTPAVASEVRVLVEATDTPDRWRLVVSGRDRPGLLARISAVLTDAGLDITGATITTRTYGTAVDEFVVTAPKRPAGRPLAEAIDNRLRLPLAPRPISGASVRFDNLSHPTFTTCEVRSEDRPGTLAATAAALAMADVDVHAAALGTRNDQAVDHFELTATNGTKLDNLAMGRIRRALEGERHRHPARPPAASSR